MPIFFIFSLNKIFELNGKGDEPSRAEGFICSASLQIFGSTFCKMWLTFDVLCCTASILNLCAIALDRFYALHDPIGKVMCNANRNS